MVEILVISISSKDEVSASSFFVFYCIYKLTEYMIVTRFGKECLFMNQLSICEEEYEKTCLYIFSVA